MPNFFPERLKQALKTKDISQSELARLTGLSKSGISQWLSGQYEPKQKAIHLIAKALNVKEGWLIGLDTQDIDIFSIKGILPLPKTKKIPLLGSIACGNPILAEENIERYIDVDTTLRADFSLRCKGDSMINARIFDGDIVHIRKQPDVENGQIGAVLINDEATLKRIYKYEDKIVLQAENNSFEPLVFLKEEMNNLTIIGRAVAFTSLIR